MRRVLTAYFCVCGTFEPKTQENGLNRIAPDNQQLTKTPFSPLCKESTHSTRRVDKFIIKSHQIRRGEMANATARNCQRPIGD